MILYSDKSFWLFAICIQYGRTKNFHPQLNFHYKCKFIPFSNTHKSIFNFPVLFFFFISIQPPSIITAFTFSIDSYHYSVIRQRHWWKEHTVLLYKKTYFYLKLFLQINFLSSFFLFNGNGNLTGSVSYLKVSCCIVNIILMRGCWWNRYKRDIFF